MQKRLILAIGLSLFVLMFWSILFPSPKSQPLVQQSVRGKISTTPLPLSKLAIVESNQEDSSFSYSTDLVEVTFSLPSATIKRINFKKFAYNPKNLSFVGALSNSENIIKFTDYKINQESVTFFSTNRKINKTYIFSNSSYMIELAISGIDTNEKEKHWLNIADIDLGKNPRESRTFEYMIFSGSKPQKFSLHRFKNEEKIFNELNLNVSGIKGTHFCYLLKNKELSNGILRVVPLGNEQIRFSQDVTNGKYVFYLGPQEKEPLERFDTAVSGELTHFNSIAQFLLVILKFFHFLVRNWGLAIILLSLLIYGLLYPLTHKQMKSMKEMQALQPHIENIRKIYKDNPQKLNKEILELYKEHKVNPMGGCLPLLLQIPIFFALYQALSRSLILKGAKFLWIKDLTEPDKLFILPKQFPVIGNEINLLPLLMALTMFLQQKLSLKSASPNQREQQRMMMVIFPIMFGFIFYSFPSGLVIYWFINSLLTLVYQWKASK